MLRTTLMLPPPLKNMAEEHARSAGISFGEFVRRALEKAVTQSASRGSKHGDAFWDDRGVFKGKVPKDLSARHDFYLYGDD